jgi:uncharacterized cupin superfamily protein
MNIEVRKPTKEEKEKAKSWGIWEKEVSEFPWHYDEKETCLIIDGEVQVTPTGGKEVSFGPGDYIIFPEGLDCTWKINKPVRKYYKFG